MAASLQALIEKTIRGAVLGFTLSLSGIFSTAHAQKAAVIAVPGTPTLRIGSFDLGKLGYQVDEYFVSGAASSYQAAAPFTSDGSWTVSRASTAPYTTRMVVIRPSNPAKFNGTVLVEWLNVTGGADAPPDWSIAHREMVRKGYAYVAFSAQQVGVEGGTGAGGLGGRPLKKVNPGRYGTLAHPGDAFSFDMFSQAGTLLKSPRAGGLLGPLTPRRVIAIGESQSAAFLTTYINALDPLARVYDGFLIHSRFGSSSSIVGRAMGGTAAKMPDYVRFRSDLRVPVLCLITETDLLGAGLPGYYGARQPDAARLRVWEVAGTSHGDNYGFFGADKDSGLLTPQELAKLFLPTTKSPMGQVKEPMNTGTPHHYVYQAALARLDRWVRTGKAPASATDLLAVDAANLVVDANGLAKGGIRTPWVDVPTIRLSGKGDPSSFLGRLSGTAVPFDKATLVKLYPGGKAAYLKAFTRSLEAAIRAGHILPEDREEILAVAAINFGVPLLETSSQ